MAVVGTPMPRTMQQSMVRNKAANRAKDLLGIMPLTLTTVFTSREASPVTVMHPATMPAMEQATATVMQPRPPASREPRIIVPVSFTAWPTAPSCFWAWLSQKMPGRLTAIASKIAREAENCSVRAPVDTSQTSTTRGSSR